MKNLSLRSHKGFTLIELLVVLGIIGILASGVIYALNPLGQLQKARDAQRKADLRKIANALEQYYQDNKRYPSGNSAGCAGACGTSSTNCTWLSTSGSPWIPTITTNYIDRLPTDPLNTGGPPTANGNYTYQYAVSCDGQNYDLLAQLEFQQDSQRCELKRYYSQAVPVGGSPFQWTCTTSMSKYLYDATP